MATNGSALVEEARKHLAKLHKETGADVQKDLGQYWEKHGTGPDMSKQENETLFAPKNPAMDMQKKKEDRLEVKSTVNAAQIKRDRTKKEYDDYVNSQEYRQKRTADIIAQQIAKDRDESQSFASTSEMAPPIPQQDEKEMRLRAARDQAEKEYNEAENKKRFEADMEVINGLSEEDRKRLEIYSASKYSDRELPEEYLVDSLLEDFGRERLDELERTFSRYKNAKRAKEVDAKAREFVSKRGGRGTLANVLSVPVQAYSGIIGTFGQLAETMIGTGGYKTMDPNAYGTIGQTLTGAIRGQTSENITEDLGDGFAGKAANLGYQGVMAAADSVAQAYLGGGGLGGATLAATNSFSQTMADASRKGATPAQAAMLATTTAGIEALSEKIPLDNLIRTAKGANAKSVIANALRQAGIEATTEEISLLGSVLAEAAILQEKSSYQQDVINGIMSGMSPDEAILQASKNILEEAKNTALVSMISGGASSLSASAADRMGMFAEEQANNNPEVNKPKSGDVAKSRAALTQKYGILGAEQDTQTQFDAEQDRATAPDVILAAMENQQKDDLWSDTVAPFRSADIEAIKADPKAMKWLSERGLAGDLADSLGKIQTGRYQLQSVQTEETQQPDTQPRAIEPEAQKPTQVAEQPEQAPQKEKNLSDTMADVFREMQEKNGKASNRMAETVMSDPAAMQELGITPEGTKAEQRKRVKEEVEKLFQTQGQNDVEPSKVTAQPAQENQSTNMSTIDDKKPSQIPEMSTIVDNKADQTSKMSTIVDENAKQAVNNQSTPIADTQNASTSSVQNAESSRETPEMQRDRINSVREQAIPVTDPEGRVVSEAAGNIYTSSRTPDSFAPNIRRLVAEGRVSHDVQTNEESLNKAAASIAEDGSIQNALKSITAVAESGRTGAIDVAKAVLIYDELVNSDDSTHKALAEECFVTLTQLATNTGRPMQLFSLFRKMTPDSQVRVLESEVQRNVQKLQKAGTVKKTYKSEIAADLLQEYRKAAEEFQKAKGDEAKKAAEQKMQDIQNVIYVEEAAKLPTTFKAKWDAWRYMAMLGNVKTQFRNVLGNTMMIPYTEAKRKIGALMEAALVRDKSKRTKAIVQDSELLKWAKEDRGSKLISDTLKGSVKLGDDRNANTLSNNINTFGDSKLGILANKLQEAVGKTTELGDMIYKNREYAVSLAGFIKARGYNAADVRSDRVPVEVMNEARNYAVNEALRATFNDSNQLSDWFSSIGRKKDSNVFGKAFNILTEGVIPFRKTPANVLARGWEYSPMGIITTAYNTGKDLYNGEYSGAVAIDRLAANMTGSAMMALGFALAQGIGNVKLRGGDVDEDEKRRGVQKYAFEVTKDGETYSYTIDWLAPANLPLLLGANLSESLENPDTASFVTACMNVGLNTIEPMLELSCLSGLNDFVESARYAEEGEVVYTLLAKAATSYFTQGIPALARQATTASQENKQTTFVTSDDKFISSGQKTIAGLGVGNAYKTDKRNAWGEKEAYGEGLTSLTGMSKEVARAVDAFFNPGTLKKVDNSAVEQEISRLNAAGYNVTPDKFANRLSYTDKDGNDHDEFRLSEEQYQTLAEVQGQTAREMFDEMVKSKDYAALDDEQKAEAINDMYLFARKTAEIAAIGEDEHTGYDQSWMYDVKKNGVQEILRRTINSDLNTAMSELDNAWEKDYDEAAFIREMEETFNAYSKASAETKRQVYEEATGATKKYLEVRDKGISHADAIKGIKAVETAKGTGSINKDTGKATVRDIDKRQAIANSGLNEQATDMLMRAYMADYDPSDESPETTEFKYQYAREELGLSAKEYAATYRAYLDNGRKAQKIAAIRALGYDYKTANALYKLYYGRMKDDLIEMYC